MPATGHPCGIGAGQVVLCLEKAVEQGTVHHLMRFVHPDGLEELVLEVRIIGLQSIDPFLNGGKGLGFRQVHQAQLGQLTRAAYGIGQLPAQLIGVHLGQGRLLMERAPLGRDAPDAAMGLVAVGMAKRGLIMSDDRVEPVGEVDGSIGSHVQIDGTEGVMGGREERFQRLQPVAGSVDGWAQTREVARVIAGDEEVALQVVGEVGRVDDLDAH